MLPGLVLLLLLSTYRFPVSSSFTNSGNCYGPFAKFNRELLCFTTVWWFERGPENIGGSRTLVSNWWLVKSILGTKKLVGPEKWIGGSGIFVRKRLEHRTVRHIVFGGSLSLRTLLITRKWHEVEFSSSEDTKGHCSINLGLMGELTPHPTVRSLTVSTNPPRVPPSPPLLKTKKNGKFFFWWTYTQNKIFEKFFFFRLLCLFNLAREVRAPQTHKGCTHSVFCVFLISPVRLKPHCIPTVPQGVITLPLLCLFSLTLETQSPQSHKGCVHSAVCVFLI